MKKNVMLSLDVSVWQEARAKNINLSQLVNSLLLETLAIAKSASLVAVKEEVTSIEKELAEKQKELSELQGQEEALKAEAEERLKIMQKMGDQPDKVKSIIKDMRVYGFATGASRADFYATYLRKFGLEVTPAELVAWAFPKEAGEKLV